MIRTIVIDLSYSYYFRLSKIWRNFWVELSTYWKSSMMSKLCLHKKSREA